MKNYSRSIMVIAAVILLGLTFKYFGGPTHRASAPSSEATVSQ